MHPNVIGIQVSLCGSCMHRYFMKLYCWGFQCFTWRFILMLSHRFWNSNFYVVIHIKGRHRSTATFERFLINPSVTQASFWSFVCVQAFHYTHTHKVLTLSLNGALQALLCADRHPALQYSAFHKGFNFSPPQVQGDVLFFISVLFLCCLHSFAMQGLNTFSWT